jgi:CubicO group peptidase (beta-lactamase class C family)
MSPDTAGRLMHPSARQTVMAATAALLVGCGASPESPPAPEPTSTVEAGTPAPSAQPSPAAELGDFPEFPEGRLAEPVADSLQAVLDGAVEQGTFRGITAAVIVADSGSWSGATGVDLEGNPLTPDARLQIASVGKTVTAAEVLRLVEEGRLGLDDPAADHLPPELAFFDVNGATIREVLGMRSGIPDPPGYEALVDSGSTPAELLRKTFGPLFPAGSGISYANINYILLGAIIEHVTARTLWETLRSDVLDHPALDGLVYGVKDALAADGWRIESDAATLARWGYELYGGFVLSDASLGQMTDFRGDWYGLGAIDFSQGTPAIVGGYGIPAIGHGGVGPPIAVMLVAFPQTGVVVAVQAPIGTIPQVATVVGALREAAQP